MSTGMGVAHVDGTMLEEQDLILVQLSPHVITDRGERYAVSIHAAPRKDGVWEGFLRFESSASVLLTPPETEQATIAALAFWASSVTAVYVEGAFERARAARRRDQAEVAVRL